MSDTEETGGSESVPAPSPSTTNAASHPGKAFTITDFMLQSRTSNPLATSAASAPPSEVEASGNGVGSSAPAPSSDASSTPAASQDGAATTDGSETSDPGDARTSNPPSTSTVYAPPSAVDSSANGGRASAPAPNSNTSSTPAASQDGAAPTNGSETPGPGDTRPSNSSAAANPRDPGWPFNVTAAITLNWTSPMINLDGGNRRWKIDPVTGYRTYEGPSSGETQMNFVGVGYSINGTAKRTSKISSGHLVSLALQLQRTAPQDDAVRRIDIDDAHSNGTTLGALSDLDLRAYRMNFRHDGSVQLEFHNATVQIPIKTQA